MLISGKGKCFHVFVCISKNFPENIFWCLEKKKENTNQKTQSHNPGKKIINDHDPRSRSRWRDLANDALRDRAVDRDLDPARSREASIAVDGLVFSSRARGLKLELEIGANWSLDWSSPLARARSLSLSLFFWKSFEVKMEVVIDFRGQRPFFSVNGFQFPENRIFRTNQTASFSKKHFRK